MIIPFRLARVIAKTHKSFTISLLSVVASLEEAITLLEGPWGARLPLPCLRVRPVISYNIVHANVCAKKKKKFERFNDAETVENIARAKENVGERCRGMHCNRTPYCVRSVRRGDMCKSRACSRPAGRCKFVRREKRLVFFSSRLFFPLLSHSAHGRTHTFAYDCPESRRVPTTGKRNKTRVWNPVADVVLVLLYACNSRKV